MPDRPRILVTGATGFIGRHLRPALASAGYALRCGSRTPARARSAPGEEWMELDLHRPAAVHRALDGCDVAYYLVHEMGHGTDYPERERQAAEAFGAAAARRGVRRVVYLGGVMPTTAAPSRHLESRARTGAILRASTATTELRAAMIVGAGSTSWMVVRDLAARLPAMVLPRWLARHSHPISVLDVIAALVAAAAVPDTGSTWYDLPGPERLSHRELIQRVAAGLGHRRLMVGVPVLTPRLSSYWIGLVTRVGTPMARELVEGLRSDLDPSGPIFWSRLPGHRLMPLDDAMALAIADESSAATPSASTTDRLAATGAASPVLEPALAEAVQPGPPPSPPPP